MFCHGTSRWFLDSEAKKCRRARGWCLRTAMSSLYKENYRREKSHGITGWFLRTAVLWRLGRKVPAPISGPLGPRKRRLGIPDPSASNTSTSNQMGRTRCKETGLCKQRPLMEILKRARSASTQQCSLDKTMRVGGPVQSPALIKDSYEQTCGDAFR